MRSWLIVPFFRLLRWLFTQTPNSGSSVHKAGTLVTPHPALHQCAVSDRVARHASAQPHPISTSVAANYDEMLKMHITG